MNKQKWTHPHTPLLALTTKLSEEAAEVGTEITDAMVNASGSARNPKGARTKLVQRRKEILTELEHVEFICSVIRQRVSAIHE